MAVGSPVSGSRTGELEKEPPDSDTEAEDGGEAVAAQDAESGTKHAKAPKKIAHTHALSRGSTRLA